MSRPIFVLYCMLFSPRYINTKKIQKRYKNTFVSFLLASVILAGFFSYSSVNAATGINKQVSFQGKVVNNDGTNTTNGSYTFLFCIYTTASPATPCTTGANNDAVWRESKSLTVTDGIFQTNLGDTTTLPGSVDFNTDNIYLGINFNNDGQMSPLVRFTAAPYAMNARTVGGLTVTDTTGTLTIPNGKTVQFADAFTTTGAFPLTLTTTASTTATLPSGTITLADLTTSQALTNKTIGSTGLTFSGATTDMTTATDEDLTLVANGVGIISLNDATTVSGALAANGGITFDNSTDTVGAFTAAGTIDMSTQILTNIGNAGTDFIATTGALTLAGVLTANNGVTIVTGALAVNSDSITSDGNLVINATSTDIQDATTVDSLTTDTGGVSIANGQSYTGAGAVTLSSASGANNLTIDSGSTGSILIGTGVAAKTITIGNASDDTFSINSSGLNVTSGGALTGVASIDTIAVSATAITFAGTGTIASTTTGLTLDSGSNTLTVAASDTIITASGITTLTLGANTTIASAGTITLDATSTTIIPDADTFQTNDVTSTGALTITAGSTAQNITLTPTTTGYVTVTSSTGTSDTIRLLPATGAAAFAGIITTTDLTGSDKTYTFPNATITVNAAGDISGTTLASNVTGSSLTSVGTLGSLTVSGALAANGGITFDASTDTVGAHTLSGTIDANTNIITNIGNAGTDFVASTGALTLAGVLTANGGITLAGSQTFTASALSYMDLGAIIHDTTAVQGLRLPQAASATPSNPTSGEGYLAWDVAGNQLITYNGSAWTTLSGGSGYNLIKNETTGLTARTTLAFLGAGVDCTDSGSQTECTIAGGSGADLQGTYDTDADGGNATISLTAADDGLVFTNPTSGGNNLSAFLLSLTQQNTTAGIVVLDMVQSSNAANGASLVANAIDGETGLVITTNGLTSGKGINVTSSSTAFTGNLADVSLTGSNAANTGNVLAVSNTGTANTNTTLFIDHRATGTGNLAMRVDDESGDTTPFIIDGSGRVGIATNAISSSASSERLLQVGSETNRGNSVTYGEVVTKGLSDYTALANIRDVFVYDTTADSDGGRWIDWATTDNLSWYTETLDDGPSDPCNIASDDRCYAEAFPRKAILVVTTDALYIFDAATNTMWMKFSQNSSGYALGVDTNNDPSSVMALNGVIYVGANGTAPGGLYVFDFVGDRMWNYTGSGRSGATVGISGRNAAVTYNVDTDTKLDISQVGTAAEWEKVNDVFVQVVSQSMVTQATGAATNLTAGQGKTYVGLATDSGVTIINLSDRSLLQYSDVTADDYTAVHITRRGKLYALNTTQDQLERWDDIDSDKASEVNGTYTRKWDETVSTGPALASSSFNIIAGAADALEVVERGSVALESEDIIYVGHSLGLAELHDHTTQAFGWVKHFNQTRQTPLMILGGINDMVLPMDDTSGTQAQDLAIANTDMAIVGSPTLGVDGVQGKAIQFDNSNDYLCSDANQDNTCDVDTAFNMSTVGWTFTIWFKHSTTAPASGADTIFEKCVTAAPAKATGCVVAYMTTTGTIVVANDDDATYTRPDEGAASYDITATSTLTYNDNQWHQLVISRTNANDIDSWIDATGMNLSTATGNTITVDGSQIVTIGASCSFTTGANCASANITNVWDGVLDDAQFVVGTTTQATLTATQVRRLYNAERPRASKKTITVTDATSATSTSLTDTGEAWLPNEFAGLIVEITGSSDTDCIGVSRRIVSNTATSMTFSPAVPGACTLDTSADFQVDPEALIGATDAVYAVAISAEAPLGEARQMCVGTNSGTDTGGITCYNHQSGPSIIADVFHADSGQTDDSGASWTGTDYDDIRAIDISLNGRTLLAGSEAHFMTETGDVRLGQGLDYLAYQIFKVRGEIIQDGISAAGSNGLEVGFTGGADLAERYYSNEPLEAGEVVAMDSSIEAGVKKTTSRYQHDILGVVATQPGIILGTKAENGYPIALVGRVPVKVTNENGPIYAGDRVTAASRPGYAMRATQAGRVIGQILADATDWAVCEGEDPMNRDAVLCTTVMVFVNLSDYYGQPVELAMAQHDTTTQSAGLSDVAKIDSIEQGLGSETASIRLLTSMPTKQEKILNFLKELHAKDVESASPPSEVFTGRVSASSEVITPTLYADQIFAKSIRADSIEGLSIWTNQIASLQEKYAGLEAVATENTTTDQAVTAEKTLLNLDKFTVGSFVASLDASVLGKLTLAGGMSVAGDAEFAGDTVFSRLANFFGKTFFKDTVSFEKAPTFGHDTAGFAIIEKGAKKVRIVFDTPYEKQPIVTIALTNDVSPLLSDADESLKKDIEVLEKEYLDSVFDENIRSVVMEKSTKGFTIVLSEEAPRDLQFSWVAISVDKAKSFSSEKEKDPLPASIPPEPLPVPIEEVSTKADNPVLENENPNTNTSVENILSETPAAP